ncbi:MAG: hypothetical protein UI647_01870 [Negativibacillus sp.]
MKIFHCAANSGLLSCLPMVYPACCPCCSSSLPAENYGGGLLPLGSNITADGYIPTAVAAAVVQSVRPISNPTEESTPSTPEATRPNEQPTASTPETARPDEQPTASTPETARPDEQPTASAPEATRPNEETAASAPEADRPDEQPTASTSEATQPNEETVPSTPETNQPNEENAPATPETNQPNEESAPAAPETTRPNEQPTASMPTRALSTVRLPASGDTPATAGSAAQFWIRDSQAVNASALRLFPQTVAGQDLAFSENTLSLAPKGVYFVSLLLKAQANGQFVEVIPQIDLALRHEFSACAKGDSSSEPQAGAVSLSCGFLVNTTACTAPTSLQFLLHTDSAQPVSVNGCLSLFKVGVPFGD